MIPTGNYVYHKGLNANGIITHFDETKLRDNYKVKFLWGRYAQHDIKHGSYYKIGKNDLWQWCEEVQLVDLGTHPLDGMVQPRNYVTSFGGRSLDRLIRSVIEINRRKLRDGSDIILNYGTMAHADKTNRNILVLNRKLMADKYEQMRVLGDLGIESCQTRSGEPRREDWIIKPRYSMGGHGIRHDDGNGLRYGEYYQRHFNKVREFRVHCMLWLDNPVPLIQEKKIGNRNQLTWNKKQGGMFYYPYREGHENPEGELSLANRNIMTKMAIEACKKLRYDIGGIDFGMDSSGQFKIFEINSRMGLKEKTIATYIPAFWKLYDLDINAYRQKRGWRE